MMSGLLVLLLASISDRLTPVYLCYLLPAILVSLTLHEWGHAYVAWRLGDPTARRLGRLSVNPLRHLDPVGTALLVFAGFGWAKPVPIDPRYFRHPRRDDFLVSIAGITVNLLLAFVAALALSLFAHFPPSGGVSRALLYVLQYFCNFCYVMVQVNAALAAFNLIPIPPLDGYHVLNDLVLHLPLYASAQAQQFGWVALVLLSMTGITSRIIGSLVTVITDVLFFLVHLR